MNVTVNGVTVTVPGNGRSDPVAIPSYFPGAPPDSATGEQTDDDYQIYFTDDPQCGQADSGANFLDPDTSLTLHIYARAGRECGIGGPTAPDLKVNRH